MAKGIVLCQGDRTTCGGKITAGSAHGVCFSKPAAREGDPVTCGKDGKLYRIVGGISFATSGADRKRLAGSLDSYSNCPCKAKILPSNSYPTYNQETPPTIRQNSTPTATRQSEPAQHAQAAEHRHGIVDTCKPKDNLLLNGVYLWTETTGAGHAFVSVHENNSIYLYTYGRYGRTDRSSLTGDGILDFFQDEDARNYYRYELYEMGARAFRIDDADPELVRKFFEKLWNNGVSPIQTPKMQDGTIRRGRTIDKYDVTGNNCTTHSVEGIKFAGSKLFEHGYTSTTTQLPIDIEEDFTIPVSLQSYLESKNADYSSMLVVEMTSTFKQQYPNIENKSPQPMGRSAEIQQAAADSAAVAGSTSPYSGGTVGGSLGSTYNDE